MRVFEPVMLVYAVAKAFLGALGWRGGAQAMAECWAETKRVA